MWRTFILYIKGFQLAIDEAQVLSSAVRDELSSDLIRLCLNVSYRSFAEISVFCFIKDWQTAKVKNIKR